MWCSRPCSVHLSHFLSPSKIHLQGRVADPTSFSNGLGTFARARQQASRATRGCWGLHRRRWSFHVDERKAKRSVSDCARISRSSCGVGGSIGRFSVGSAREGTRGVLHMGAAMAYRGDREHRWLAGRRAWRPFIPTAKWNCFIQARRRARQLRRWAVGR